MSCATGRSRWRNVATQLVGFLSLRAVANEIASVICKIQKVRRCMDSVFVFFQQIVYKENIYSEGDIRVRSTKSNAWTLPAPQSEQIDSMQTVWGHQGNRIFPNFFILRNYPSFLRCDNGTMDIFFKEPLFFRNICPSQKILLAGSGTFLDPEKHECLLRTWFRSRRPMEVVILWL